MSMKKALERFFKKYRMDKKVDREVKTAFDVWKHYFVGKEREFDLFLRFIIEEVLQSVRRQEKKV